MGWRWSGSGPIWLGATSARKVGDCRSDPHSLRCGVPQGFPYRANYLHYVQCTAGKHCTSTWPVLSQVRRWHADLWSFESCIRRQFSAHLTTAGRMSGWNPGLDVAQHAENKRRQNRTDGVHESPVDLTSTDEAANHYARWLRHHRHRGCAQPRSHHEQLPGRQGPGLHCCEGLQLYHPSQIARVRRNITTDACKLAVLALLISRLDYCNGLLSAATEQQLSKLQSIQNRAARPVVVRPRVPRGQLWHASPSLQQLHWLPVRQRLAYKLYLHVWNCLHDAGPSYLRELLTLCARDQRLGRAPHFQPLSGGPKRRVGGAGFSVTGPLSGTLFQKPSDVQTPQGCLGGSWSFLVLCLWVDTVRSMIVNHHILNFCYFNYIFTILYVF